MAHCVESMFYVREKPWHGLGVSVEEAPTSAEALRLAGLDWSVEQKEIRISGGAKIPNYKANVRSSDQKLLGIVTDRYKVIQNQDAFTFTDNLIGDDVRYETAGSLQDGKKIWLLAKMPERTFLGDAMEPYLCFSNTHDGSGAVRVCMTPVRVVCNNTLNLALSQARRSWSVRHTGDLENKMHEASMCLQLADDYMQALEEKADHMANTTIYEDQLQEILSELFPLSDDSSDREKQNIKKCKDEFMICYFAPDLAKFRNTAWGVINAASDMLSHNAPRRKTANYRENNWGRIMDGHILLDKTCTLLNVK